MVAADINLAQAGTKVIFTARTRFVFLSLKTQEDVNVTVQLYWMHMHQFFDLSLEGTLLSTLCEECLNKIPMARKEDQV